MTPAQYHMGRVASTGCVICRRLYGRWVAGQVHHIAEGSSKRSDFATACLCDEHHNGPSGFHKRGRGFLVQFRVPWENEEGLLMWQNEDLALMDCGRLELEAA